MSGQARVTSVAEPSLPPQALIALALLLQRRIRVPEPALVAGAALVGMIALR